MSSNTTEHIFLLYHNIILIFCYNSSVLQTLIKKCKIVMIYDQKLICFVFAIMCVKGKIMSVNTISGVNNIKNRRFAEFKTSQNKAINFEHAPKEHSSQKQCSTGGVFLTTAAGVGTALALISKKQGFSLNPQRIIHSKPKDWAIFKIYNKKHPDAKVLEFEEPEILTMAGGSVAGGLLGGAVFDDKKHFKAKAREAVNQMLGNVIVPVLCVGGISRVYDKYKKPILNAVPQIKYSNNNFLIRKLSTKLQPQNLQKAANILQATTKYTNKFLKILPPSVLTASALVVGIVAGNKVSNFINEKVFHKKVERKIQGTDFTANDGD